MAGGSKFFLTFYIGSMLGANSEELDSDDLEEEEDFEFLGSDNESPPLAFGSGEKTSGTETVESLKSYMNEMDYELASTKIGKSFTTQPKIVRLTFCVTNW